MKRCGLLVAVCLAVLGTSEATGQARIITGEVRDSLTGSPIGGGRVQVQGTALEAPIRQDGTFAVGAPPGNVVLVIASIGFRRRTVQVGAGRSSVQVLLTRDVFRLEEIVVTGQATGIERRNLANAVSTVSAEDLERAPTETVERSLQGRVPGANVQANSNAPGGGMQVELRGITSFLGGSPLYVVDGVIISNASIASNLDAVTRSSTGSNPSTDQDNDVNRITDLNPADIESIEILKGASASAIYGSKASNGVIIIRTRRGRPGPVQVDLSQRFGTFDLARTITRRYETAAEVDEAFGDGTAAEFNFDPDRNWEEDLAGRNPLSSETRLSLSGGDADTRFFVSGVWKNDDGIMPNNGFDKQSLRVNVDRTLGDRALLQVSTNLVRTLARRGIQGNDNTGTSPWFAGLSTPRFLDLTRRPDGTFPVNPFAQSNPLQTVALLRNDEEVWRFIGAGHLEFTAVQTDRHTLRLIGSAGIDRFSQENTVFSPPEMQFEDDDLLPGTSALSNSSSEFMNLSANAVHEFVVGPTTSATTSAGVQYDTRDLTIARVVARNLLGGQENIDQGASIQVEETRERREDFGVYLQEELLFNDRFLLTAGVRADQTSGNTDADKLFLYPKAATSYRWPTVGPFDELKLRAAYGESGKQPQFGQKFTPLDGSERIEGILGFQPEGSTVSEVRPERQREIELGVDATLSSRRASIEATVYRRWVSDLLFTRGLAPSTGFAREVFNGGSMRVNGIEAGLTLVPAQSASLSWVLRSTFGLNRSKVTDLPVPPFIPEPGQAGFVFGPSLGAFFIEEGASATQIIGNIPDGNGDATLGKVGDSNPNFRVGVSNDLSLGAFNLFVLFDWQQGGQIINLTKLLYDLGNNYLDCSNADDNPCAERLGTFSTDIGSTYIEDATFLKLRELTLSWDLPDGFRERIWGNLRYARLILSARNLLTFTDYTGMDPEVSNFGTQSVGRNVDVAAYPRTRSFWIGFDLGF